MVHGDSVGRQLQIKDTQSSADLAMGSLEAEAGGQPVLGQDDFGVPHQQAEESQSSVDNMCPM